MDTQLTNQTIKSPAGNNWLSQNHPGIERPLPPNLAFTLHTLSPR